MVQPLKKKNNQKPNADFMGARAPSDPHPPFSHPLKFKISHESSLDPMFSDRDYLEIMNFYKLLKSCKNEFNIDKCD